MKKTITLNEGLDYNLIENQVRIMMRRDSGEEKVSTKGLRRSLEKIGDGEITEKSSYDYKGDRLMYKEMLNNDSLILVVHGAFKGTPYDKFDYGYKYDIGLYRNNPRSVQYGGGYGASGIIEIQHTQLLGYSDYDINHKNENIISEVCNYIKSELVINENMKKTITLKESELISLIERMIKEYGEDSGGQDMTYGIYKRDNKGLGQSIDFRMMSPMNVAIEIEEVLPEKYIDTDVEKAVDNYIENASINIQMANKYMKDDDWWDTLYYNIKDVRDKKNIKEETGTASSGAFSTALDQPIRKKIRTGLTKEEFIKLKEYMEMDESLSEGKKKTGTKLCARGKAAAKSKFKVYPSAYANGFAVQVCKGRMKGLDGQKKCSGSYC
jgi:hypothetical protein